MAALGNLLLVLGFAWLVRGLLGAREVTWPRLLAAVVLGFAVGGTLAALLLIDVGTVSAGGDVALPDDLFALALPFSLLSTMVVVVVFELLFTGPPRRPTLAYLRPHRAVHRWVGLALRAVQVTRIATRHGLAPLLGLRRGASGTNRPEDLARRARTALEEAGGMFVKLGQLLATRPDLLPPEALAELGRLHAAAAPLPRAVAEAAIAAELSAPVNEVFAEIDWTPLGSASIAQVHAARLADGREMVVKVRRPGLEEVVARDLAIARWLARTAERRTSWGRAFGAAGLAEEFADALQAELDFRLEARHAAEMATAVKATPQVRVPAVAGEHTTERLLVMERLVGVPLSKAPRDRLPGDARALADDLCASQVTAMLQGERFHGDPHPGNVLLLDGGGIGLIDFGITGRLDTFERASMFQMLLALKLGEPSLLSEALVAVGAISPARQPDDIERALSRFMAANLSPGLPPAEALLELLRVITALGVRLPPQTSTMFRALATLAGTLEHLSPGYPLVEQVADLGGAELRERTSPGSVGEFVQHEWAQLAPLLRRAPRHADRIATLLEHGSLTTRVRLFAEAEDVRVAERLLNRAVLAVLALGVGLVSVLMLGIEAGPSLAGADLRLLEGIGWFGLFAATVLVLRVLLDILRSDDRT